MKIGDVIWLLIIAVLVAFIAHPKGLIIFSGATAAHPYLMGFFKFTLLASMGELLAGRIATGAWRQPKAFPAKVVLWGFFGIAITLMFTIFNLGVKGGMAASMLPGGETVGTLNLFLSAFFTSALMNLTFGYAFMACHRFTDTILDIYSVEKKFDVKKALTTINWVGFLTFVSKTIVLFWIPAHTLVFLLPPTFRILAAAGLSIALGILLAIAKSRAQVKAA